MTSLSARGRSVFGLTAEPASFSPADQSLIGLPRAGSSAMSCGNLTPAQSKTKVLTSQYEDRLNEGPMRERAADRLQAMELGGPRSPRLPP